MHVGDRLANFIDTWFENFIISTKINNNYYDGNMKKLAIIGAHGIPAKYGGYCTLAEYLAEYKPEDFELTVYCVKSEYNERPEMYKGAHLVYVDLPARGIMAWKFHTWCLKDAVSKGMDCMLLCGSNGGFTLPFYHKYRDRFYLNIGGVEWKRNKFNWFMRNVMRVLMKCAVFNSGHLVADNIGIHDYIIKEYGRDDSVVIPYGGDQATKSEITPEVLAKYPFLKGKFAVAIARIQRDNNTEMLLESFKDASMPLVYIGNWNVTEWAKETREKYSNCPNLILLDAIYDIPILNQIRSNCALYVHGHSAGGTNPSLVEAMHLGVPLACYDNGFNNYTTHNKAFYFKNATELSNICNKSADELNSVALHMKNIAIEFYRWETVAQQYYEFFRNA